MNSLKWKETTENKANITRKSRKAETYTMKTNKNSRRKKKQSKTKANWISKRGC